MQYSKELLDKIRSGDTSMLQGLPPFALLSLGLQLQQEALDKAEASIVDFNKVGETMAGMNTDRQSTKHISTTYFKIKEETE